MKHKIFSIGILLLSFIFSNAQKRKTEKLLIVALDGMRWQEVFGGVDSALMNNPEYTKDAKEMKTKFWDDDVVERRKKLFPFLWNTVAGHGQLHGNRQLQNYVNVANPYQLTYPGFSETLTGIADTIIKSNKLIVNKNANVLTFLNQQKGYEGRVAVFTTSDLFPYLLNKWEHTLYVNSDTDKLAPLTKEFKLINDMQSLIAKPTSERADIITYFAAREYMKFKKPKVLYVALGETDAYAHAGLYDAYINTANAEDAMIADLWNIIQSMPEYKGKTSLIVTCDHGRGDKIKSQWRNHGPTIEDSGEIWIAAMGPDMKVTGEVKEKTQLYQRQLATTIAALLGFDFKPAHEVMPPVKAMIAK